MDYANIYNNDLGSADEYENSDDVEDDLDDDEAGEHFDPGFLPGDDVLTRIVKLQQSLHDQNAAWHHGLCETIFFPIPTADRRGYRALAWPGQRLGNRHTAFAKYVIMFLVVAEAVLFQRFFYLRTLVYVFPGLWPEGYIPRYAEAIRVLLGAHHRSDLNIRAQTSSLLAGRGVSFGMRGTAPAIHSSADASIRLPDAGDVRWMNLPHDLGFILVVEKRCFYNELVTERLCEMPLVAGKTGLVLACAGTPDAAIRDFLVAVEDYDYPPGQDPPLMFVLADADSGGLATVNTFQRGTRNNPHTGVSIVHLGLLPSHVVGLGLPLFSRRPLTARAKVRLRNLVDDLTTETGQGDLLRQEALALLRLGAAVHIDAVTHLPRVPGVHPYTALVAFLIDTWCRQNP